MNQSVNHNGNPGTEREERLGAVLADWLEAAERGEATDEAAYVRQHPEGARELAQCFADWKRFPRPGGPAAEPALPGSGLLGDFRLLREVGRGGMGVVYEAEQVSLSRRVALKVLPFAATMDPRHLRRFHNEARAAASLHHEHIVPVYGVGQERSVHFYAMQFIDGRPLSELIARLREENDPAPTDPAAGTDPAARAGTLPDYGAAAYWRRVAELGVQAAEALEYAHSMGVVHRDVKPGNLLLDCQGKLWVADFGLAKLGADAGVTMTGDLLGTLRYMSPEQALAKHGLVDHRTDVYSLGVTLYELLTLEPAFGAGDREELLRQIAFEEPRLRLRGAPAELETVVRKSMAKDPAERYPTAKEVADDLKRFLNDEPIRARRPTLVQRARKWTRRHQPVLWSAAVSLLAAVAALGASAGWVLRDRADRHAQATEALDRAVRLEHQGKWPEAWSALQRAETLVGAGGGERLRGRARDVRADLEMVRTLEEARLERVEWRKVDFDSAQFADRLAAAFRNYGIDVEALDPAAAAEQLRSRSIRAELAAGLGHWARARRRHPGQSGKDWKDLMALSLAADPDSWRERLWRAWESGDRGALVGIAESDLPPELPPSTVVLLASTLHEVEAHPAAAAMLYRAQRRHPADFWVNYALGCSLAGLEIGRAHV